MLEYLDTLWEEKKKKRKRRRKKITNKHLIRFYSSSRLAAIFQNPHSEFGIPSARVLSENLIDVPAQESQMVYWKGLPPLGEPSDRLSHRKDFSWQGWLPCANSKTGVTLTQQGHSRDHPPPVFLIPDDAFPIGCLLALSTSAWVQRNTGLLPEPTLLTPTVPFPQTLSYRKGKRSVGRRAHTTHVWYCLLYISLVLSKFPQ